MTIRPIALISRAVMLEVVRRQEFFIILILVAIYLMAALVFRIVGIEDGSTGTFLLNLGMKVSYLACIILVVLTASRQIPFELENRTIYPLLAKPLTRAEYFLGKWAAASLVGIISFVILLALSWGLTPKMEYYNSVLLAQTVLSGCFSFMILAAFTLMLSLLVPQPVNIMIIAVLVGGGEKIAGVFRFIIGESGNVLGAYIPQFSRLDLITRYTDGIGPVPPQEFALLVLYCAAWTGLALSAGVIFFQRRSI